VNTRTRALGAIVLAFCLFLGAGTSAQELPSRLSDEVFWKLVTDFSEQGGSFLSDNFVSNERQFQNILSELTRDRSPGGAYLGVGPEQNFTYVVALKPKIAFIFDIRRQNMIQHLMYKALFELSSDRVDFLSRLFSRKRPQGVNSDSGISELFAAFDDIEPEPAAFNSNLAAMKDRLINGHRFQLTADDEKSLEYVYSAFFIGGPMLAYSRTNPPGIMPSLEELMTETDERGVQQSFLATEENFEVMKSFEANNLLVPLVGDFGGSTAIRSVGDYLRTHGTEVTAFYVSNVEQYLFRTEDAWKRFYGNVSTLPIDDKSVFIRSMVRMRSGHFSPLPVIRAGYSQLEIGLFSISDLNSAFGSGIIQNYNDILSFQLVPAQ
jgi:hypothetical protein